MVRKVVSIPIIILILFTGFTVNLAAHYCNGIFINSKISFSGELATCDMEHTHHDKPGINETDHSCQDLSSAYTFSADYIPTATQVVDDQQVQLIADLSFPGLLSQEPQSPPLTIVKGPPGCYFVHKAGPEMICVFRI